MPEPRREPSSRWFKTGRQGRWWTSARAMADSLCGSPGLSPLPGKARTCSSWIDRQPFPLTRSECSTNWAGGPRRSRRGFGDHQLQKLLLGASRRARAFVAVEPRRSPRALFFSLLVGCIGCNRVTRHDAPVSVRAGFAGGELSALWPTAEGWALTERPVGCFGHIFVAHKLKPA